MFVVCLMILNVSSMKWAEEDEIDSDADEFSTDTTSIKERFYEILHEVESLDPIRGPCGARCLACLAVCRRTRLTIALIRRCQEKCYRFRR